MKTFEVRLWLRQLVILSVALCLEGMFCGRAATREDFGYRAWTPPSPWKLLLVVVTYSDSQNPPDLNTLDQRVFGPSPSVAGFFQENSRGQMTFQKAGSVLLTLPTSERYANWEATVGDAGIARDLYFSNFVAKAFSAAGINLADYDTNPADNKVTQGELDIVILSPRDEGAFSQRRVSVPQPASGRAWLGDALGMNHDSSLATIAHELGHHCQTYVPGREYLDWGRGLDLYGRWDDLGVEGANYLITIMGNNDRISHFDGYEKMRFGWLEPRIYSMTENQTVSISAAQLDSPDGPVVIYDPNRGPGEYFVLEYRTPTCSNGSVYDQPLGSGLVIWHVQLDANKKHLWLADALLPTNSQSNWWWCIKCYGMYYSDSREGGGSCKAGGTHEPHLGWEDFRVPFSSAGIDGENNWNYCWRCSMLFYGPNIADSRCPKGGAHTNTGSGNYTAPNNGFPLYPYWDPDSPWHRCNKCQSMFNANGNQTNEYCPAGGQHIGTGSPSYDFEMRMQRVTIGALGFPDLLYNSSAQWTNGTCTPPLRWFDGTPTSAQIYVQPFQPGADSIVVEWGLFEAWVDFAYIGAPVLPESGTFALPFNTLPEGVNAVLPRGTVRIKAGQTAAGAFINKPLRLESYGGTAIIGK